MKVLSLDGGGVKGLFYLYALTHLQGTGGRPLSEQFDLVVGCSIGAIVGGLLVTGQLDGLDTYDAMDVLVDRLLQGLFDGRQDGSPVLRPCYDGRSKSRVLRSIFGDVTLGGLGPHKKLAVVTAGFGTLEERVFTSWGDPDVLLADALDASSALPLFFPPVRVAGSFYWDGVLTKNKTVTSALRTMARYWQHRHGAHRDLRDVLTSDEVCLCSMGNSSSVRSYYLIREDGVRNELGLLALVRLGTLQAFFTSSGQEVEDELLHYLLPGGRYLRVESTLDTKSVDRIDPQLRQACRQQAEGYKSELPVWAQR